MQNLNKLFINFLVVHNTTLQTSLYAYVRCFVSQFHTPKLNINEFSHIGSCFLNAFTRALCFWEMFFDVVVVSSNDDAYVWMFHAKFPSNSDSRLRIHGRAYIVNSNVVEMSVLWLILHTNKFHRLEFFLSFSACFLFAERWIERIWAKSEEEFSF